MLSAVIILPASLISVPKEPCGNKVPFSIKSAIIFLLTGSCLPCGLSFTMTPSILKTTATGITV